MTNEELFELMEKDPKCPKCGKVHERERVGNSLTWVVKNPCRALKDWKGPVPWENFPRKGSKKEDKKD